MRRVVVDLPGGPFLDDLAGIHHVDPIGVARHHAQIVGDDDEGDAEAPGQILHQFENLRLDRHVERRRRLVGDDQLGLAAQRHGDHHPLAHAAAEMVGILFQPPLGIGNSDHAQQLHRPRVGFLALDAHMMFECFGDLTPDGEHRIERRHRLLEYHGDVGAPHLADFHVAQLQEIPAHEEDLAADDLARRIGNETEDRKGAHRLAAARLADDADRLPLLDVVRHPVHRLDRAGGGEELGLEIL